jgi:hypothetical protein
MSILKSSSSSSYYKKNDDENKNKFSTASSLTHQQSNLSFKDRLKALETAGLTDTSVKSVRTPQYSKNEYIPPPTYETPRTSDSKFKNVLFGSRVKSSEAEENLPPPPTQDEYRQASGGEEEDEDEDEDLMDDSLEETSKFECPPFKPPSRSGSNDSLPHSPNFDDPKIRSYSYDITKPYEEEEEEEEDEEDDNHSIQIDERQNAVRLVQSATLATKPPVNEVKFLSIDKSPNISPLHTPKLKKAENIVNENDLYQNYMNNLKNQSRSESVSSAAPSSSSEIHLTRSNNNNTKIPDDNNKNTKKTNNDSVSIKFQRLFLF